jgi:hypothetical protein
MANKIQIPFSARNQGAKTQIDNDFPDSARVGVEHLLHDLVARRYIASFKAAIAELERIGRLGPTGSGDSDILKGCLSYLSWEKMLDFCERSGVR